MSVKIRLTRTGARNRASFRVVAADSRSPRDGRFLEILGWYDPNGKDANFELKMDRIEVWREKGAQISDTVKSLIKRMRKGAKPENPQPEKQEQTETATAAEEQ